MVKAFVSAGVLLCGIILLGCAADGNGQAELDSQRLVAAGDRLASPESAVVERVTDVAEWTATGVPGVDYDPHSIVVWYRANAQWPEQLPAVAMAPGLNAAAQPNPILRQNKQYEAITDAIAAKYAMRISQQVYWQQANFARFDLVAGTDGAPILSELRQDFSACIESADYAGLATMDWVPTDPDYLDTGHFGGPLWGMHQVNCEPAWDATRGVRSVRVAVVDSGIRLTHEELAGVVMTPEELAPEIPTGYHLDILHGDNTVEDLSGHGTMCAGAVGAATNGRTIIGVAPGVSILPIKIHDTGSFPWTDGYAGITLAHLLGADIISCSWGHGGGFNNQERTIVNQVTNGGSLVVAAAGNDNTTSSHYPSDFDAVLCVGATDPSDVRSDFSNYGSAVDIAAPGQWMKRAKHTGDSAYDENGGGTSYACPMVAGAAALLLSADSSLTNDDLRMMLETTGDPVTGGFQDNVKRLNVGNAMDEVQAIQISLPDKPYQIAYAGMLPVTPVIKGEVTSVECYLNGLLVETTTVLPWTFFIDTSSIAFDYATIECRAYQGVEMASASLTVLVDNTAGVFPLSEGFEDISRSLIELDVKNYDPALLQALRTYGEMGTYWTPADMAANGAGRWGDASSDAFEGFTSKYCGDDSGSYDSFEADVLVSRLIDLTEVADPTLVFHHHYNIQRGNQIYDRAWVLVTDDYGLTYQPAMLRDGSDALFSGYEADWTTVEIDLSPFAGKLVHIVLSFESGKQNAGQEAGQPAGWWVDDFTVATDYQEHVPSIGAVSVTPFSTVGDIVAIDSFDVAVADPTNVARVEFVLEYLPYGSATPLQIQIETDSQPFQAAVNVPFDVPNQVARLYVNYFSGGNTSGPVKSLPVYIFNQLGDANADGAVNQLDTDSYSGMIGLTSGDEGFIPFFDSDLDGVISEADAAAVGYHWGE